MDFKLNRENLICPVTVVQTDVGQAAEHDFILPDYCPDIFRVLKCSIQPAIVSVGINGGRLTFDLNVMIRAIYRSADGEAVNCIEQSLDFTRTVDLPADAVNPSVSVTPTVEYVNCRVVNSRRLDVRGNVICRVKVVGEQSCGVVCGAYGGGIELRKSPVVFPTKRLTAAKRITVVEELELSAGKPPFSSVVRCGASVIKGEQKVVSGKLVTKGTAVINLLYLPKDSAEKPPERMNFEIPFSQIADVDGIDEGFELDVDITASKCALTAKNPESTVLECELVMLLNVSAVKYETCELVTDAYSTAYECECTPLENSPVSSSQRINTSVSLKSEITCSDGRIEKVYDLWCENPSVAARLDESRKCTVLYGKATFCMLSLMSDGAPAYTEKECAFEQPLENTDGSEVEAAADVRVRGCSFSITESGADVSAELEITGRQSKKLKAKLLSDIKLLTDKPRNTDKRCAMKICYSEEEESLWDIAKKYSAGAQDIIEETDSSENGRRILIIPMKN